MSSPLRLWPPGSPRARHEVTLAADASFERLGPGRRVEFAPIRADFQSLLPRPGGKRPSMRGDVFPVIRGMLEDSWTVARSAQPEVIVAHEKSLAAPHLSEKLGVPHVRALTVPMLTPTREFPLPGHRPTQPRRSTQPRELPPRRYVDSALCGV